MYSESISPYQYSFCSFEEAFQSRSALDLISQFLVDTKNVFVEHVEIFELFIYNFADCAIALKAKRSQSSLKM